MQYTLKLEWGPPTIQKRDDDHDYYPIDDLKWSFHENLIMTLSNSRIIWVTYKDIREDKWFGWEQVVHSSAPGNGLPRNGYMRKERRAMTTLQPLRTYTSRWAYLELDPATTSILQRFTEGLRVEICIDVLVDIIVFGKSFYDNIDHVKICTAAVARTWSQGIYIQGSSRFWAWCGPVLRVVIRCVQ